MALRQQNVRMILFGVVLFIIFYFTFLRDRLSSVPVDELEISRESDIKNNKDNHNKNKLINSLLDSPKQQQQQKLEQLYNKINLLYESLSKSEAKFYSQNGEDGVIIALLNYLKLNKKPGFYVEFGTGNGDECNSRYLRTKLNWTGLLMDRYHPDNPAINLHKEIITHRNILDLFGKYKVPVELELFSEDTDYNDYWLVEKVLSKYRPKIVVHEVNQQPPSMCVTVVKTDEDVFFENDVSSYHGGNVCAFYCLARRFDYTMVYCEKAGVNCFWIRNDLIAKHLPEIDIVFLQKIFTPKFLFKKPGFSYKEKNKAWHNVTCEF